MYEFESIIAASGSSPVPRAPYDGAPDDLGYLRNYLVAGMTTLYQVDASIFDQATLTSTSLVRDYISRLVFDNAEMDYQSLPPEDRLVPPLSDVAVLIRHGVAEQCGFVNLQLQHAYRSFGYQSTRVEAINGPVDSFTVAHVTTEVYIVDYDKAVVQDAYINFMLSDAAETPLSHQEVRAAHLRGEEVLFIQGHPSIYDYQETDASAVLPIDQAAVLASTLIPYGWLTGTTALSGGGITGALWEPGSSIDPDKIHLASGADAQTLVQSLADGTRTWQSAFTYLQGVGHDVRAFAFVDPGTGEMLSEWITFRLQDGSRVSTRFDDSSFEVVAGAYDEIVASLANGLMTSSADLAGHYAMPPLFLGSDGLYQWHWEALSHVRTLDSDPQLVQSTGVENASVTALATVLSFLDSADNSPVYVELLDLADDGMRILRPDGSYLNVGEKLVLRYSELAGYQIETGANGDALHLRASNSLAWSEPMYVYPATRIYLNGANEQVVELRDAQARLVESGTTHADGSWMLLQWDASATEPWSAVREEYDSAGRLLLQQLQYDDNRATLTNWEYNTGALISTRTRNFDASGTLVEDNLLNADGTTYRGIWDTANVFDWAFSEESRDTTGQLISSRVVGDNGTSISIRQDVDNTQSWASQQSRYVVNGELSAQQITADDGSVYRADWNNTQTGEWRLQERVRNAAGDLLQERTTNRDGSYYTASHDAAGSFSWSQQESFYNPDGALALHRVTNDNGASYRSSWDTSNTANWTQREQNYDATGRLVSDKTTFDDGSHYQANYGTTVREVIHSPTGEMSALKITSSDGSTYSATWDVANNSSQNLYEQSRDGGQRRLVEKTTFDDGSSHQASYDVSNSAPWAVLEVLRTAAGNLVSQKFVNDDGSSYQARWDTESTASWSLREQSRNSGGQLTAEKITFDDGNTFQSQWDPAGDFAWSLREANRDSAGMLVSERVVADNGDTYQITHDTEGLHSWAQREVSMNANGDVLASTITFDDGSKWLSISDVLDNEAWASIERSLDTLGRTTHENVIDDSGSRVARQWDAANIADWALIESNYDAAGQLLSQRTYRDGEIP